MENMVKPNSYISSKGFPTIEWNLAVRIPEKRYSSLSFPTLYQYSSKPEGAPRQNSDLLVECCWKAQYWIYGDEEPIQYGSTDQRHQKVRILSEYLSSKK